MLGDDVKDSALEEMIKAGNEERQLAIDINNVDTDGTPMCTVDGQWSKRSWRTKYNAFSGAVIYFFIIILLFLLSLLLIR